MRFRLLGQLFRLDFVPRKSLPKDTLGDCQAPRTDGRPRRIRVADDQSEKDIMETVIHEAVHGCGWHIDEEFVEKAARDMTRLLWRLGYRKVQP